MNSMTGYGASQLKNRQLEIEVHVKSVNGRFLEVRFHLPKEYSPFENDLRKVFASNWARGTLDVYVHRRPGASVRMQTVKIREENARNWTTQLEKLAKKLKVKADLSLRDILQMPYVMEHQDRLSLLPGDLKLVEAQLRKAALQCQAFRAREGLNLKKELLAQLKSLEASLADMEGWRDEALKSAHQRLKSRLATLETEKLDASRLALETALMIDKMDVHEEVVRLKEHVKACRTLIMTGDGNASSKGQVQSQSRAQGKKLDFYCQELLREVNTIGSKSQLASLTQVVVVAKSVIEKFREQVQNIE
jgi:uncharacterized protein (TIGR00255 family)